MSDFLSIKQEIEAQLTQLKLLTKKSDQFKYGNKEKNREAMTKALNEIADNIQNALKKNSTPVNIASATTGLSEGTTKLDTNLDTDTTSHEFSNFLSSIGESVVASQENLDRESIKYLKRLKGNDTHSSIIPPTVFRIPRLKASLNLGIERSKSQKLNVLIYGKEEESKMINQQSVELEIMAVPASAELMQSLQGKIPQIQFVLTEREREFLFENIKTAVTSESENIKKGHYGDMLDPKNSNRVIFWRTTKSKLTDLDVFLVLYAGKVKAEKSRHVGLWQLKLSKNKPPILEAIIRYDLAPNSEVTKQDQGLLHNFVSILAERQEALLKG